MQKLFGILLLLCLAAPLVGTYAGLRIEKYRVKKAVKKRLMVGVPDTDLVFFQFSKNDSKSLLRWEHDWEFEYREQMYDVVKKIEQGDSVLLWCWWDHPETALNKQLRQLVAQNQANDQGRQEKERRLVCFFLTLFHEDLAGMRFCCVELERSPLCAADSTLHVSRCVTPPSPPPDRG